MAGIEELYYEKYSSPIGELTLTYLGESLSGLWFTDTEKVQFLVEGFENGEKPLIADDVHKWLDTYFSGREPDFLPELCPEGSPFAMRVWDIIRDIPYGSTISYGQIAAQIAEATGKNVSAQAVGGAVGHNPIAILIPCHRVIGSDGTLTGYAGGLQRKKVLLEMEGIHVDD